MSARLQFRVTSPHSFANFIKMALSMEISESFFILASNVAPNRAYSCTPAHPTRSHIVIAAQRAASDGHHINTRSGSGAP